MIREVGAFGGGDGMKARAYAGWVAGGLLLATLVAALGGALIAQSVTYGGISFPIGDRAFADRVAEYIAASCVRDAFDNPEEALGPPDAERDGCQGCGGCDSRAVALGFRLGEADMRGRLVLEFVDNMLINGPGDDLFVYITNDKPALVEISADGFLYTSVGVTTGYPGAIDIGAFVASGTQFRFVRLTDVPADEDHSGCPGPSIDAVGARGPAEDIALGEGQGGLNVHPVGQLALALAGGGAEGLLIVLDHSSSMEEIVEGEVKIEVAKEVILDLMDDLGAGSQIGLREFAGCGMSDLLVPIQPLDTVAFTNAVTAITTYGATPIAYTLEQVPGDFASIGGKKLILLITDGMETCKGNPVKAAQKLISDGLDLRINVVGFDIGRVSTARDQLLQIAQATGGAFLEAANREELRQALSLSAPFSYTVYDVSGAVVFTGRLGEEQIPRLDVGTYRVVVNTQPPIIFDNVVITDNQTTTVTVEQP
jgi:hypothetical protein